MIPLLLIVVCVLASGTAACSNSDADPASGEARDLAVLKEMEAAIDTLIGGAPAESDADCRAIAFGDKPCGGPWSYKIYSVAGLDTLALAGLVAEYNKYNRLLNERYGWSSDCMYATPPRVGVISGHCASIKENHQ